MPAGAKTAGELMDHIYRHQRRIYDLTRRYYLLGRDEMIDALDALPGHAVLEIGCGTGRNLIVAARKYPKATFLGIDVSTAMLEIAKRNIDRAGLAERITIAQADATTFDAHALFGIEAFDRIFCSYVLSMVPAWPAVIDHGADLLAQRGCLHIVDFGQFSGCPRPFATGMRRWLKFFHVHPIEEFTARLATLAEQHGLMLQCASPYRGYAVRATLERKPARPAARLHRSTCADRHRHVMSG